VQIFQQLLADKLVALSKASHGSAERAAVELGHSGLKRASSLFSFADKRRKSALIGNYQYDDRGECNGFTKTTRYPNAGTDDTLAVTGKADFNAGARLLERLAYTSLANL
jgi:hypothetical protein